MGTYRKLPVEIEAVQLLWENWSEVCELADVGELVDRKPEGKMGDHQEIHLLIPTLEGLMEATEGDWIIKGVAGEVYPCKPDIFALTYEEVTFDQVQDPAEVVEDAGDLLEDAWSLIANAYGGEWDDAPGQWHDAAVRFRDGYGRLGAHNTEEEVELP